MPCSSCIVNFLVKTLRNVVVFFFNLAQFTVIWECKPNQFNGKHYHLVTEASSLICKLVVAEEILTGHYKATNAPTSKMDGQQLLAICAQATRNKPI